MKRILITAACIVALPLSLRAQTTAADSAAAPARAKRYEVRLGGFMISGERNSAFNNSVKTGTGSTKGVEVLLRASGVGIQARSSAGVFDAQPDVVNADVSVILGPPAFSVFLGGAKRALSSSLGTQIYTFGRVGAQMTFLVGGTGLRAQVGGWGYIPSPNDEARMDISGEGEASILYSPQRLPIFVQIGYRNEVFKSKTMTTSAPEEVRGIRIGGGLQFGGK